MDKEKNTRPSTARTTTRSQNVRNLSPAQVAFIAQKTPGQYIKERMGPGGTKLKYVEVGYVINLLNQVFNWD